MTELHVTFRLLMSAKLIILDEIFMLNSSDMQDTLKKIQDKILRKKIVSSRYFFQDTSSR